MFAEEVVPAKDGLTFEQWMAKVDELIALELGGLTSADLADRLWRDEYEDGMTPAQSALDCLEDMQEEIGW